MRDLSMRGDEGFTLLEVMFVVLVLGILVSIAVSTYAVSTDRSLRVTCQENVRVLEMSVVLYEQQNDTFPDTLADLAEHVKGRPAYASCPKGDRPYDYDDITGQIGCPNHPIH